VTMSTRFFSLIHYGMDQDAAELACLSTLSVMVPWACLAALLRRSMAR